MEIFDSLKAGGGVNDGTFQGFMRVKAQIDASKGIPFVTVSALGKTTSKLREVYKRALGAKKPLDQELVREELEKIFAWHNRALEVLLLQGMMSHGRNAISGAVRMFEMEVSQMMLTANEVLDALWESGGTESDKSVLAHIESLGERLAVIFMKYVLKMLGYSVLHIPATAFMRGHLSGGKHTDAEFSASESEKGLRHEVLRLISDRSWMDGESGRKVILTEGFIGLVAGNGVTAVPRGRYGFVTFGSDSSDLTATFIAWVLYNTTKNRRGRTDLPIMDPYPCVRLLKCIEGELPEGGTIGHLIQFLARVKTGLVSFNALVYANDYGIAIEIVDVLTGKSYLFRPNGFNA